MADSSRGGRIKRYGMLGSGLVALGLLVFLTAGSGPTPNSIRASQASDPAPKAEEDPEKQQAALIAARNEVFSKDIQPFLKSYCIDCHGPDEQSAGIRFDSFDDVNSIIDKRTTWQRVAEMIESGTMPPEDYPIRPKPEETGKVIAWLDQHVFNVDCNLAEYKDPGRVTIRRLNRAEYNNTIRDLVGVDFQPAKDFPSDDVGEGFDNNGDVLSLPPLLLEKYLNAAEEITDRAIVAKNPNAAQVFHKEGDELRSSAGGQDDEGWFSLASTGQVSGFFQVPMAGEYKVRVVAKADQAGNEPAKMEMKLGRDQAFHTFEIQGDRTRKTYETTFKTSEDRIRISAGFINDYYNPQASNPRERDRNLYILSIELEGPLNAPPPELPETHKRIFIAKPGDNGHDVRSAAVEIFRKFTKRAYRRPVEDDEIMPYVRLVEMVVNDGEPFELGVQIGVQAVLVSPHFLFRVETDQQPENPMAVHKVSNWELASRLSYFLWSSMPDEELFRLAEQSKLQEPQVLQNQIRRMLQDPKSQALVDNFATQWLNLRMLDDVAPDPNQFGQFNNDLRKDMMKETLLLFTKIMKEDRSILEFLDADYTHVNERLAKFYGMEGVKGEEFQQVSIKQTSRRGVLTHASILTLTSNPTRTSPVKRGKWIMENILGTVPPDPPPNIPDLEETGKINPGTTIRQQLAIHRENPACASCHVQMDALGLGFENFDAIGQWRDQEGKHRVDPSGALPDGSKFEGPLDLIKILRGRDEEFARAMTEKMMIFALGRGLTLADQCAVKEIAVNLKEEDYRFTQLVTEIVLSKPFLMRRGEGERTP